MHCKMNVKTKDHAQKDKINAKWFRAYRTSIRGRAKVKSITNTYRDREYGLQSGFCLWPTSCVQKKFEKWQMAFHYIIVCSRKTNRMNETESSRLFGFFLIWLIIWDRKNECWCELHRLVGRKKTFPTLNQINGRISTGEYGTLGTCTKEHTILDGKTGAKKKSAHMADAYAANWTALFFSYFSSLFFLLMLLFEFLRLLFSLCMWAYRISMKNCFELHTYTAQNTMNK